MGKAKKRKAQRRPTIGSQTTTLAIVKSTWTTPEGQPGHDYQMVNIPASQSAEQVRQEALSHLQAHGFSNCRVEILDPDNIPPGALPDGISFTLPLD